MVCACFCIRPLNNTNLHQLIEMKLHFITPLALAAVAVVSPSAAQGAPVSPEKAISIATSLRESASPGFKAPSAVAPSIVMTRSAQGLPNALYAVDYGRDNGFALIAGDDNAPVLLGYSDSGSFDASAIPAGLEQLLDSYAIMVAQAAEGEETYNPVRLPGRENVAPMLTSTWNQTKPYNDFCPSTGRDSRAPVGCVALSTAQVMRSHAWPPKSRGYVYSEGGRIKLNTEYDWASMPDSGLGLEEEKTNNMAKMLYELARSLFMVFTASSSGTYAYYTPDALVTNFSYDTSVDFMSRNFFTDSQWEELVYGQMAAGQSVPYDGITGKKNEAGAEGHSYVLDGYDAASGFFHINWGWEGKSDGYYLLADMSPAEQGVGGAVSGKGFVRRHGMVSNIRVPQGGIQPMRLSMTGSLRAGDTPGSVVIKDMEFDGWQEELLGILNLTGRDFTAALGMRAVNVADPSEEILLFEEPREWVRWSTRAMTVNVDLSTLPDGRYLLYPVYKDEFGRIGNVQVPVESVGVLDVTVNGGTPGFADLPKNGNAEAVVSPKGFASAAEADAASEADLLLQPGFYGELIAYVKPLDADAELEWSSSDNSVAVAHDGVVIARGKTGRAVITAAVKGNPSLSRSFLVEVEAPVLTESLSFSKDTYGMEPESTLRLDPVFAPTKVSNMHLAYTSSNESIATVDADGVVTAKNVEGSVEIKAITLDGAEAEAVCTVNVGKGMAVEESFVDSTEPSPVYTTTGIRVLDAATVAQLESLPEGLYIWRGKKYLIAR